MMGFRKGAVCFLSQYHSKTSWTGFSDYGFVLMVPNYFYRAAPFLLLGISYLSVCLMNALRQMCDYISSKVPSHPVLKMESQILSYEATQGKAGP